MNAADVQTRYFNSAQQRRHHPHRFGFCVNCSGRLRPRTEAPPRGVSHHLHPRREPIADAVSPFETAARRYGASPPRSARATCPRSVPDLARELAMLVDQVRFLARTLLNNNSTLEP